MSTRAELKSRAKSCLKHYYWWAVLASLLAGLLGGGTSSSFSFQFNIGGSTQSAHISNSMRVLDETESGADMFFTALMIITAALVIFAIAFVIAMLWCTFVGNLVRVGCCAYYMESREAKCSVGVGKLFWAFENGRYTNIMKVMFVRWLYTFLWSLLFIVPGIIKSYEYYLVPYIMHDTPDIHYKDALAISKEMMRGNKWRLFVLELSFIGWSLLAGMCCGVGLFFLTPYIEATTAEFYAELRKPYMSEPEPYDDVVGYGEAAAYHEPVGDNEPVVSNEMNTY